MYFNVFILNLYSVINIGSSARILAFYPAPFHSHQSVFHVITEELARRGHELVVLAPDTQTTPIANVTQIDVLDVSFKIWEDGYKKMTTQRSSISVFDFLTEIVAPIQQELVDAQLSTPEMQAIIRDPSQHFDLILAEAVASLSIVVGARFKAPVVLISSFLGTDEILNNVGALVHPILLPDINYCEKCWKKSFLDTFMALKTFIQLRIFDQHMLQIGNNLIEKHFGENSPTMENLKKNIHMLLLNAHHIWDNNRPVPPSVVYMGALQLKKPKPIPHQLQTYLDSSKNGVLYMSLGSKVKLSDFSLETVKAFLEVFQSLTFDVLIKWNGDELPNKPANVRLAEWVPQNDMLHHQKIKAFIMQGGLQSIDEAIAAMVPLITFPVFGDQFYNSQRIMQLGIGIQLDINDLKKEDLHQAIISVAHDDRYRDSISRLSRIMQEQRAGGLQKAVYFIDYVAKFGALHLRSPLADASFSEYVMLDVIVAAAIALAILFIVLFIFGKLVHSSPRKALQNDTKSM